MNIMLDEKEAVIVRNKQNKTSSQLEMYATV